MTLCPSTSTTSRWQRWAQFLARVLGHHARPAAHSRPPSVVGQSATTPPPRPAIVDHVVDPEGSVRLVRIMGNASHRTIDDIDAVTCTLSPHTIVHLDFVDAEIHSESVMRELERLADRLERAYVHVRMVGLDPNHPALRQGT